MSDIANYRCIRCGCGDCSVGKLYAAGGFWSRVFDVEGRKFSTVTCERCGHTELFRTETSNLSNVFDLFVT